MSIVVSKDVMQCNHMRMVQTLHDTNFRAELLFCARNSLPTRKIADFYSVTVTSIDIGANDNAPKRACQPVREGAVSPS